MPHRTHGTSSLNFNRLAAAEFKLKNHIERGDQNETIFSQFVKGIESKLHKLRLSTKTYERPFTAQFIGEESADFGGPFRDVLDNFCTELTSPVISLLTPTSNNVASYGDIQYAHQLDSQTNDMPHALKFKVLGGLLAYAARSRHGIGLDCSPFIWERLLSFGYKSSEQALLTIEMLARDN